MAQRRKEAAPGLSRLLSAAAAGGVLAFGVCVVMLAAAAGLVAAGKLPEGAMGTGCLVTAVLACWAGGCYTACNCRSRMLLMGLAAAVVCWLLWVLAGGVCFGGAMPSAAVRLLCACGVGGCAGGFLAAGIKNSRN